MNHYFDMPRLRAAPTHPLASPPAHTAAGLGDTVWAMWGVWVGDCNILKDRGSSHEARSAQSSIMPCVTAPSAGCTHTSPCLSTCPHSTEVSGYLGWR